MPLPLPLTDVTSECCDGNLDGNVIRKGLEKTGSGGPRTRTGDTMIFSHVLSHLSYPAAWRGSLYTASRADSRVVNAVYQETWFLLEASMTPSRVRLLLCEATEIESRFDHFFG